MGVPEPGCTIQVLFSCGAASAVAAKLTLEKYGSTHRVRIVNNPVKEEGEDNRRFLRDCEHWLGTPIEIAKHRAWNDASADDIWRHRRYMSGIDGAPCTTLLKKEARQQWEARNAFDIHRDWIVLGFTVEEKKRHENFVRFERANTLPILIEAGITKEYCAGMIAGAGLRLPEAYAKGYPNANCRGCVKATSPTYWNLVRREDPDVFAERAALSRELGVRLVRHRNQRIFLDELPEDAKGRALKSIKMPDCGVFCEERV